MPFILLGEVSKSDYFSTDTCWPGPRYQRKRHRTMPQRREHSQHAC